MKHGSVSGPNHGPRWESKCGSDLRIQHGLNEFSGSSYGRVVTFYRQGRVAVIVNDAEIETLMKTKPTKSYLSAGQRKTLLDEQRHIPHELRQAYAVALAAWKATWFAGGLAFSSDPNTRAVGAEYDALIALGPRILPLLIGSLADPENFMALTLYDAIQTNPQLLIQYQRGDERILDGEQGRARRVVQAWFANR